MVLALDAQTVLASRYMQQASGRQKASCKLPKVSSQCTIRESQQWTGPAEQTQTLWDRCEAEGAATNTVQVWLRHSKLAEVVSATQRFAVEQHV